MSNGRLATVTNSLILGALLAGCEAVTAPADLATGRPGGPLTTATAGNGPIAFMRDDPATGSFHIVITNPDGTGERQLPLPFDAGIPVWSPDGSRLLFSFFGPGGVRPGVVNSDGSGLTTLDVPEAPAGSDIGCEAWSPDGGRLLCSLTNFGGDHTADGVYTIRSSDGGALIRLTVNPYPPVGNFGGGDIPGGYSPDGSQFVFTRARPGAGPVPDRNQTGALFVANADGTGLRQITPYGLANSHDDGVAHWSPDGREILFAGATGSLFAVRTDGTGVRAIPLRTGGDGSYFVRAPDWSPDGTSIVFSLYSRSIGQFDVYTARPDGTALTRLTRTPAFEEFADWGTEVEAGQGVVLAHRGTP